MHTFLILAGLILMLACAVTLGVCAFSVSNVLGVAYLAFVGLYLGAALIQASEL